LDFRKISIKNSDITVKITFKFKLQRNFSKLEMEIEEKH